MRHEPMSLTDWLLVAGFIAGVIIACVWGLPYAKKAFDRSIQSVELKTGCTMVIRPVDGSPYVNIKNLGMKPSGEFKIQVTTIMDPTPYYNFIGPSMDYKESGWKFIVEDHKLLVADMDWPFGNPAEMIGP